MEAVKSACVGILRTMDLYHRLFPILHIIEIQFKEQFAVSEEIKTKELEKLRKGNVYEVFVPLIITLRFT